MGLKSFFCQRGALDVWPPLISAGYICVVEFLFTIFHSNLPIGISHRVATCQGNVREKQNFLQVREKSGNFGHLTHVRELSGNFVMSCQGIVRKFCHDIILRLKLPSYDKCFFFVLVNIFIFYK